MRASPFRHHCLVVALAIFSSLPCFAASFEFELNGKALDHVTSGDMDGNGKTDLVIANTTDGAVTILMNTGSAHPNTFKAGTVRTLTAANPTFVAVADLNGDGRLDVVCGNSGGGSTVRVFLQNAPGLPAGTFPGTPSSSPSIGSTSTDPVSLVLIDLNGDGKPDIVTANKSTNNISVLLNNGDGTFAAAVNYTVGTQPVSVAAGDVNGDGIADVVVACGQESSVFFLLNDGAGTLGFPYGVLVGDSQKMVALKDINKDGKLDLLVLQSAGTTKNNLAVCLGVGDGTFGAPTNNLTPPKAQSFAVADVTGDGNLDVLLATQAGPAATNGPSIFGLRGNGDGTFLAASDFRFDVDAVATATVVADFDGDGQPDVATSCVNPAPAGLYIEHLNPRATISSLSPFQALKGGAQFTLTVNGSNFQNGAVVNFNSIARSTTFGSATQLTATIPVADLTKAGKFPITVTNPTPGGFASDPAFFSVYVTTIGTLTVLNTNDSGDDSLRQAMLNARNGDTITFDSTVFDLTNSDAATVINVLSELPALDDGSVTIDAQDRRVTVNGSGAGSASGFVMTSSSNKVMGLAIVGFSKSGISISGGAQSNTIGGPRSTGTGPNGQGLRISNCGAFGIEISGSGTNSNVIKGCWIGLDASGTVAQPNLSGILVQGGAQSNIIGGTADGEANAISGNSFEGITFSGSGTDNNVVLGNIVGAAGVATASRSVGSRESIGGRTSAGNGSAGVFLSKGTQGSKVGGTNTGEGNIVGNNGGNGVEVRAATSKNNSSRANKISKNAKGGIALFDGSNNGVTAPSATEVTVLSTPAPGTQRLKVKGTAARDGTVELFNDSGLQGEFPLGRATVSGGAFEIDVDSLLALKLNATLTDTDGNTSAFSAFSTASADSDGDGVSDELEDLVGTDKNNSSDAPADGGVLAVDKAQAGVSFIATGKDSIKLTILFFLPDNFVNTGSTVSVMFGSVIKTFTLNDKGQSPKGLAAVSLKGGGILPQPSKIGVLSFSAKGDLRTGLVASGLTDKTTSKTGDTVKVPVAIGIITGTSKFTYSGQVTLTYKATQGKSGKAAKAK